MNSKLFLALSVFIFSIVGLPTQAEAWFTVYPPPVPIKIIAYAEKQAEEHEIDWDWLYRLVEAEAEWHVATPQGDDGKSFGLCQIQIETARWWGSEKGSDAEIVAKLLTPKKNIHICLHVLQYLLKRYDGNQILATVAFNAGTRHANYVRIVSGLLTKKEVGK